MKASLSLSLLRAHYAESFAELHSPPWFLLVQSASKSLFADSLNLINLS